MIYGYDLWDSDHIHGYDYIFPSLIVGAALENWEEDDHFLLTFKIPVLDCFESNGKKVLYLTCVKVSNGNLLTGVSSKKWMDFRGLDPPPRLLAYPV